MALLSPACSLYFYAVTLPNHYQNGNILGQISLQHVERNYNFAKRWHGKHNFATCGQSEHNFAYCGYSNKFLLGVGTVNTILRSVAQ